jgi:hypothetical protein
MTIPFEEFAAKSLADPEVKREYDALAPEFEALAKKLRARKRVTSKVPNSRRPSAEAILTSASIDRMPQARFFGPGMPPG